MEALLQRVDRLERENLTAVRQVKLMKLAGLAVVLGIAVILFCGAKTSNNKVIEAQEFRLVNEKGRIGASLSFRAGSPGLYLYDYKGETKVELEILNVDIPRLALYDENGKQRVDLSLVAGSPGLTLSGENGKESACLAVLWSGGPGLGLYDKNGNSLPIK